MRKSNQLICAIFLAVDVSQDNANCLICRVQFHFTCKKGILLRQCREMQRYVI